MKIIKFEKSSIEDEIFKQLRGKAFFAVSAELQADGDYVYTWHTKEMREEVIIMGIKLLESAVINGLIEQVKDNE